jgi:hypothetical protein
MLQTLNVLPAVDERSRFGSVQVGYDKICTIRGEFAALARLAAFSCNCTVDELTMEKIQALLVELEQTQIGA